MIQQICFMPEILIFHIKRFEGLGRKLKRDLDYTKIIDISELCDLKANLSNQNPKYSLIGLAEHVGSSESSGHYTAHTLRNGKWYKFDDEYYGQVRESEALSREAYLLFY